MSKSIKTLSFVLFFLISSLCAKAQVNVRDSLLKFTLVQVNVGVNTPFFDLKDRFGTFTSAGGQALRKTKKGWIWGGSGSFIFGDKVKERSMVDAITVGDGFIISSDGTLSDVRMFMRGFTAKLHFGKIIPVWGPNKNSGIIAALSGGIFQHKIRLNNDENTSVPILEKDYLKGFDKLSNGLIISPSLGYQYFGNNRMINFFFQFEYSYANTQNRRSFNFDTGQPDNSVRNDSFFTFRAGWTLPIYRKAPADFYYF